MGYLMSPKILDLSWSNSEHFMYFIMGHIMSQRILELSPYPCFISLLYLDLYVLGDDALIS